MFNITVLSHYTVYPCKVCSHAYKSLNDLEKHLIQHDPDNIDITNEAILKHIKSAYVALDYFRLFQCEECGEYFPKYRDFSQHRLKHILQAVNKSASSKKDTNCVDRSIRNVFKNKIPDVSLFIKSTISLENSMLRDVFPNTCHCGVSFYTQSALYRHRQLVHEFNFKSGVDHNELKEESSIKVKRNNTQQSDKRTKTTRPLNQGKSKKSTRSRRRVPIKDKPKITLEQHTPNDELQLVEDDKKRIVCLICKKTFKHKSNALIHLRIHTGERPYKCNECDKRFTQTGSLKEHLKRHTGIKDFKCRHCDKAFYTKADVVVHERTHTKVKPYKCTYCEKSFSDPSAFGRHTRIHTGYKPYQCPYCPMKYSDASALLMHKLRHENKKKVKCKVCKRMFYTKDSLMRHMAVHGRKNVYECQYCGLRFGLKNYLKHHKDLVHIADIATSKYKCDICNKKFYCKMYLEKHILVHIKNYTYECNECGRCFSQKQSMVKHFFTIHNKTRKFKCDYCNKNFALKEILRKHILMQHSDILCNQCSKRFTTKSELVKHKSAGCLTCYKCLRAFPIQSKLDQHLKTHSTDVTNDIFECDDCGEKFTLKSMLQSHIQNKHMECVYCFKCYKKFFSESKFIKHRTIGCEEFTCTICEKVFYRQRYLETHMATHTKVLKYECDACGQKFPSKRFIWRHLKLMHEGGLMQ